jgi:hypothetical protein
LERDMKSIKFFALMALVLLVSACGGGGGSAGATVGGGNGGVPTGGATTVTAVIADSIFELDKSTIKNSGTDSVALSVTTLDAARNVVPGVPVNVAVDSGGVFEPAATGSITNSSGKFSGKITAGGDRTDRVINAKVTVNGIQKAVAFGVTGSQISVTPVPAVARPGETVTLNIRVADFANIGIANIPVQLSGSAGFTGTRRTDLGGNLTVTSSVSATGTYLAVVTASGVSASSAIRVVSEGGDNSIPVATGAFSGASLLADPTSIPPNQVGSTSNRSVLTAKFIRQDNSTIENMRARFEILQPSLGANEFISIGDALTYSNSSGVATAEYFSGQRTSPTNGVVIRVCFDYVDFPKELCPNSRVSTLTVNSQPLDISIGNFNKLESIFSNLGYVEKFLIQVGDASGNAVVGAVVSVSVDITHFGKGIFNGSYFLTGNIPPTADNLNYPVPNTLYSGVLAPSYLLVTNATGSPTVITTANITYAADNVPIQQYDLATRQFFTAGRVWCVNEDRNRNGFKDAGEDINGNGLPEPSKSEIVVSFVDGNKTNAQGQLLVQVTYPQNVGRWLAYTLKATTSVVGSQGSKERSFITDYLLADEPNGSFRTPPYGRNRCIDPN